MAFIKLRKNETGFLFAILGVGFGICKGCNEKEDGPSITFTIKIFKFHTFISFAIV